MRHPTKIAGDKGGMIDGVVIGEGDSVATAVVDGNA